MNMDSARGQAPTARTLHPSPGQSSALPIAPRPKTTIQAFELVYRANLDSVFGFLVSRVGRELAEDLTAETFARALGAFDRYEDRGIPHRAWLLRIAHNLVIGRARCNGNVNVSLEDTYEHAVSVEEDFDLPVQLAELRRALDHLPDGHRTVLDLRYLRELTVPETAAVLGISEEAVRALTYRALKRLRANMSNSR